LRQVGVHLDAPAQDGGTVLVLLTNVPATRLSARALWKGLSAHRFAAGPRKIAPGLDIRYA